MMGKKSATSRGTMGLASCTWSVFWRGSVTFLRILFILWILKLITGTLSRTQNEFWFCFYMWERVKAGLEEYVATPHWGIACRCTPKPHNNIWDPGFWQTFIPWVLSGMWPMLTFGELTPATHGTAPDATLMCHVGRRIEKTQYHVKRQYSYDNTLQIQPCVSVGCVTNSWADL